MAQLYRDSFVSHRRFAHTLPTPYTFGERNFPIGLLARMVWSVIGGSFRVPHEVFGADSQFGLDDLPITLDFRNAAGASSESGDRLNNATDAALVSRLVHGDEPAMAEIVRRHGQVIESFSRRILHNPTLAEEVAQDVFLRLWSQPTRYDTTRGSLRSYLLAQSHGRSIDLLRSENARRLREQREGTRPARAPLLVEDQVVQLDVSDRVREAMSRLDARERRALELAYFEGFSYRETAQQLGLPEGTVKSQIRTGMRRMRVLLAESMRESTSAGYGLE